MTTPPVMPPKRSRLRRLTRFTLATSLLVVVALGVAIGIASRSARTRLEAMIAKLDSADPNWRLHDLEINRPPLAEDRNSALLAQKILAGKPGNWPGPNLYNQLSNLKPQDRLTAEQAKLLKADVARSPETINLVRRMAALPQGYLKIDWPPDAVGALLPAVQQVREIASIGRFDAMLRCEEKDFDGALESCRAILSSSRANEPCCTLIQLLVRIAIQAVCLGQVERVLAQGEPSDAALAALQKMIEDELAQPVLTQTLRGERALSYWIMEATYRKNPSQVILLNISSAWAAKTDLASRIAAVALSPFGGSIEANEVACLETMTELLESSKRSEIEENDAFDKLPALGRDWGQPILIRQLLPGLTKMREAYLRGKAHLRTTLVAIATERYRLKHKAWPITTEALVPEFLAKIPTDPCDGQPLRFRQLDDGLLIYSVGVDKRDNGGQVSSGNAPAADTGLRLWNVAKRGQAPAPKSADPEPES